MAESKLYYFLKCNKEVAKFKLDLFDLKSSQFFLHPSNSQKLVGMHKGFPGGSISKESVYNAEDLGSNPGSGSPGEGTGYPLQYSCLENSMDREPGRLQSMESQRVGHD